MTPAPQGTLAASPAEVDVFARDVADYLTRTPRQLPSRYLYDALGSALFDAICRLPWYPVTRAETALIAVRRGEILQQSGNPPVVAELGSGSGEKLALLLGGHPGRRVVHLIDVSASALDMAARTLGEIPATTVVAHRYPYEEGLRAFAAARPAAGAALLVFLGSNIGNMDPDGARTFLAAARASLRSGDHFLAGADLVKPERELLRAYDDPLGVTAAFDKNLLVRLNRELGADFDIDAFAHRAVWNEAESRIEMHLESLAPQTVVIPRAELTLAFDTGERIWTESSYKYDAARFTRLIGSAGFDIVGTWSDEEETFLHVLAQAR